MVDYGLRTAGSGKHNKTQQYTANGCVTHARRMGGSVVALIVVCAVVCWLPGICRGRVLMNKKQTESSRYVRTWYKIRPTCRNRGSSRRIIHSR